MLKTFDARIWSRKLVIAAIALVLPFVLLEIWSINRLVTLGVQISTLENTKAALRLENQVLENEIAQKSSLATIESKAKLLGFDKINHLQVVQTPNLALNR